jgi:ADP-ribose pyrophosphatase
LIEETGYTPVSMIFLARFYNAPCFCDGATEVFLADVTSRSDHTLPAEDLPTRIQLVDLSDIESLIASGTLVDAKTIIALLMARGR